MDEALIVLSDIELESEDGEVDLSERGEKSDGAYLSKRLVDRMGPVSFRAFWQVENSHGEPRDVPGVGFQLSTFHLVDEESGRAFHSHLTVPLSKSEVAALRTWLGFMLKHWGDMDR